MTNYREILRLDSLGLNKSQIAEATGYSRTTVITVLRQAEINGISYPIPQTISDKELAGKLYPSLPDKPTYKMPDYEYVHRKCSAAELHLNFCGLNTVNNVAIPVKYRISRHSSINTTMTM